MGDQPRHPCHDHEHELAYVRAIADVAKAMSRWLRHNPSAVLEWHEVLVPRPARLAGNVETLAASPDAERLLREVDAETGGNTTLRMARIALGFAGQMDHLPDEIIE